MALEGVGGLNPKEQKILADGKITPEEAKGLTAAEKKALAEKLSGHENEVEGFQYLREAPADETKNFVVKTGPLLTIDIDTDKIPKLVRNVFKGLLALTGMGLTSCKPMDKGSEYDLSVKVNINIPITFTAEDQKIASDPQVVALLEKILAEIEEGNEAEQKHYDTIVSMLAGMGLSLDKIVELLEANNLTLAQIAKGVADLKVTGDKLTEQGETIIKLLQDNKANQAEILDAIVGLGSKFDGIKEDLTAIINGITENNKLTAEGNALLAQILNKLSCGSPDDREIELLKEMLDLLKEIIQNQQTADANRKQEYEDQQKMLQKIYYAIVNLGTKVDKHGDKIYNALMDLAKAVAENRVDLTNIEQLLTDIKNQSIDNGTKLDELKATASALLALVDHIDGDVHDLKEGQISILEAINKIVNATCDDCCDEILLKLNEIIEIIKNKTTNEGVQDFVLS